MFIAFLFKPFSAHAKFTQNPEKTRFLNKKSVYPKSGNYRRFDNDARRCDLKIEITLTPWRQDYDSTRGGHHSYVTTPSANRVQWRAIQPISKPSQSRVYFTGKLLCFIAGF